MILKRIVVVLQEKGKKVIFSHNMPLSLLKSNAAIKFVLHQLNSIDLIPT
jgi:hypothetical protein